MATPYGVSVLHYYGEFVGNAALRAADVEWDPPVFGGLSFFQFVIPIGLAAGSTMLALRRGKRPSADVFALTVITGAGAALAVRNNVWLGMAAALLIADTAGAWMFAAQPIRWGFVGLLTAIGLACGIIGLGRLASESNQRFESLAPLRAIDVTAAYARSHPCARTIADGMSVSALLWRHPAMIGRVAFDGQIEAYSQRALFRWVAFQAAATHDALRIARRYELLLASKQSPRLATRLSNLRDSVTLVDGRGGIAVLNRSAPRSSRGC
jgi:hypothetical protein